MEVNRLSMVERNLHYNRANNERIEVKKKRKGRKKIKINKFP